MLKRHPASSNGSLKKDSRNEPGFKKNHTTKIPLTYIDIARKYLWVNDNPKT